MGLSQSLACPSEDPALKSTVPFRRAAAGPAAADREELRPFLIVPFSFAPFKSLDFRPWIPFGNPPSLSHAWSWEARARPSKASREKDCPLPECGRRSCGSRRGRTPSLSRSTRSRAWTAGPGSQSGILRPFPVPALGPQQPTEKNSVLFSSAQFESLDCPPWIPFGNTPSLSYACTREERARPRKVSREKDCPLLRLVPFCALRPSGKRPSASKRVSLRNGEEFFAGEAELQAWRMLRMAEPAIGSEEAPSHSDRPSRLHPLLPTNR